MASALDQHVAPSVPPPASAPVPVSASSEPSETAAVAPARGCAYARSYPTDAYSSTCPAACLASGASTGFLGAEGDSHGHGCPRWAGGNGYTLAACARSTQRDTGRSKAERRSGVCRSESDSEDAAPSPSSRSPMQAGRGTAVEASSGGAYAVQLTSESSAAEAHASFRALRAKFPNQLGGREPIVRRTDLGAKGIYYRAMVGPFASMEKAAGMCRTLKAAGGNCLVQRN